MDLNESTEQSSIKSISVYEVDNRVEKGSRMILRSRCAQNAGTNESIDVLSRGVGNLNRGEKGSTELGAHKSAEKREEFPYNEENRVRKNQPRLCNLLNPAKYRYSTSSEDLSPEVDKKQVRSKTKRKLDVDKQSEVDDLSKGIRDKLILHENQYGIRGSETSEHRGNSKKSTFNKNVGRRERNRKKNRRSSLSSISLVDYQDKLVQAIVGRSKKSKNLLMDFFQKDGRNMLLNVHQAGCRVRQSMSSILTEAGPGCVAAFKGLYDSWFDSEGMKQKCLIEIETQGVSLSTISSILSKAGARAPDAFIKLYNLLFMEGYLECIKKQGINLSNISSILHGAGAKAEDAFKDLYNLWFDENGDKTHYLETLEGQGVDLIQMSSILHGAGAKAATAFKGLYEFFSFGEGKKAVECFTKAGFLNLSAMVSGSGANFKQFIIDLEKVLFDRHGNQRPLLKHFLKSGFDISNLSDALCHSGVCAARYLIKFHDYCFDDKGNQKQHLIDLFNQGFSQSNLCMIVSGKADCLNGFYNFCFGNKTKGCLSDLLGEEGFSCNQLSSILHGVGVHSYSASKEFHNLCFGRDGKATKYLTDFYEIGFVQKYISELFSIAEISPAFILQSFHDLCFCNTKREGVRYIDDFLMNENSNINVGDLCKILKGSGMSVCSIFENLHNICFDQEGKRTDYFSSICDSPDMLKELKSKSRKYDSFLCDKDEISDISTCLKDLSIQEKNPGRRTKR
ncbi:hypothetical protein [Wolbachia sp. wLmal]|uniref:hypothetical protein n=1 Tax=Wolbachia sp. wLmal TaxID=3342489 RepID=UPI003C2D67E5